ncbi:MAG: serine/threonine protein kinase [Deltaproteobacteria bacterium]|nr:serine/threonine protein kinase [Deltaproteobacteria bacterium]
MGVKLGILIDEYKLLAPLGTGGMADVYLAKDTRLERAVALKMVKGDRLGDPAVEEGLRREAQFAARITHPHVASIFRSGEWETQPYYVMELLTGGSLAEIIEHKSSFTIHQYLAMFAQACAALQSAVDVGVIHRDVKPGNLMLDPAGRLKLTDFGLARVKGEQGRRTSWLMGTPLYIAPEIVQGEQGDMLSDVYSLAGTFFHLFCGRPPYVSDGRPFGVIEQHRHAAVPSLKDVNKKTPSPLRDLLMEMMSKDPRDRPHSFTKVGQRVRSIAEGMRAARLDERMRWCSVDLCMTPANGDRCGLCKKRYAASVIERQLFDVDIVGWVAPAAIDRVADYMATAAEQKADAVRWQLSRLPFRLADRVTAELAGRMQSTFTRLGAEVETRAASGKSGGDGPGSRRLDFTPLWPPSGTLSSQRRGSGLLRGFG